METALEVRELKKKYSSDAGIENVSFKVGKGEVFGIIGPNGAGKSTLVETIIGIKPRDEGEVEIFGIDPVKNRRKAFRITGVQLQETSYPDKVRVFELCELFASFYKDPADYRELLDFFELTHRKNAFVSTLSGGEKQKLSIVISLLSRPKIIFLDELTSGLDPKVRRDLWHFILKLKEEKITIILVTHYMEEAKELCDRIGILKRGSFLDIKTPDEWIYSQMMNIIVEIEGRAFPEADFESNPDFLYHVSREEDRYKFHFDLHVDLKAVLDSLLENFEEIRDIKVIRPSLEDVYLNIVNEKELVNAI